MSLLQEGGPRVDILIAETDARTRHTLRRLLDQEGYHCEEAGTGREAIALAQEHCPQCVLLDLVPEDDIEVARKLRADPRTRTAHIHCLTWPTDQATQTAAARAGCDRAIRKPVDANELLEVVSQELGGPRQWAHGLSKGDAEDLLDWLERQGSPGEVQIENDGTFAVRRLRIRNSLDGCVDSLPRRSDHLAEDHGREQESA